MVYKPIPAPNPRFSLPPQRSVVCRLHHIQGCEQEYDEAMLFVGTSAATSYDEIRVFVTRIDQHLYVHSNYITAGAKQTTKILTIESADLFDLLCTCVFHIELPGWEKDVPRLFEAHCRTIRYQIKNIAFANLGAGSLYVHAAGNVEIPDEDSAP